MGQENATLSQGLTDSCWLQSASIKLSVKAEYWCWKIKDNMWIMTRSLVKKNKHSNKRWKLLISIWPWISVSFLAVFFSLGLDFSICNAGEIISTCSIPLVVPRNVWCLHHTWEAYLFSSSFSFPNQSYAQPHCAVQNFWALSCCNTKYIENTSDSPQNLAHIWS